MTLIASLISFFGNGLILYVILKNPSLRKNDSIFLVAFLSLTDFLSGILAVPYTLYLIAFWSKSVLQNIKCGCMKSEKDFVGDTGW